MIKARITTFPEALALLREHQAKLVHWQTNFPENDELTIAQFNIRNIIQFLDTFSSNEYEALKREVLDLKKKLEDQIQINKNLSDRITSLEATQMNKVIGNKLMDCFGYFRDYQLKFEKKNVKYPENIRKMKQVNALICALKPPTVSAADSEEDEQEKQGIQALQKVSLEILHNLNVAAPTVIRIADEIRKRNGEVHTIDNAMYDNKGYMKDQLNQFLAEVQNMTDINHLFTIKIELIEFVNRMIVLMDILVS